MKEIYVFLKICDSYLYSFAITLSVYRTKENSRANYRTKERCYQHSPRNYNQMTPNKLQDQKSEGGRGYLPITPRTLCAKLALQSQTHSHASNRTPKPGDTDVGLLGLPSTTLACSVRGCHELV
jgi:hypothetical protein